MGKNNNNNKSGPMDMKGSDMNEMNGTTNVQAQNKQGNKKGETGKSKGTGNQFK